MGSLKSFKDVQVQCLGKWFSGGVASARLGDGLDDLEGLFQPKLLHDSVNLKPLYGLDTR